VAVLGRRRERAEAVARQIEEAGGEALPLSADVVDHDALQAARAVLLGRWGRLDILVNAAGGNAPQATVAPGESFFHVPPEALQQVIELNLLGTMLPSQVFGEVMARSEDGGCIVNVSSMTASRPLSRVVGYSAAKAGVENFTRWLAVELARVHGPKLRVNAVAPGFFLGEQNRALLLNEDGSLAERGKTIIDHTPAGRFGQPDDLIPTVIWLCGPGAAFVNGVVVPVDGGFGAWSGV
jgi:NAD(P)-dependent dehydrogenase (short-subunit alcohol dehydrogenase family)